MTLFGEDTPLLHRAWIALRGMFFPRRPPPRPEVRTLVVAHRGLARRAPENTVAACQLAVETGADGLELDVCVTRDGHAVAWHDRDPDTALALARQNGLEGLAYVPRVPERESNLRRPVSRLTLEELRGAYGYLRAQESSAAEPGCAAASWPIESLEDCVGWAAAEARAAAVFLDLKLEPTEGALTVPLLDMLQRLCVERPRLQDVWLVLITPHQEVYALLRQQLSARAGLACVRLAADFERPGVVRGTPRDSRPRIASVGITARRFWPAVREDVMEALIARARGEIDRVIVWTPNDAKRIATLVDAGVDAILTDDVALARLVCTARLGNRAARSTAPGIGQ